MNVNILQIGDIHFPDARSKRLADLKDKAAPGSLVSSVSPPVLLTVVKEIIDAASKHDAKGALFCGDLTDKADIPGYESCVQYLNKAMGIADPTRWPLGTVHVVPGNHDVNQAFVDPKGVDLFAKFAPLRAAWDAIGLPILATSSVRATTIADCLNVFSVNSCLGCRETRSLPAKIQDELKRLFAAYSASAATPDDAFALLGEQLDTPAFSSEDISTVADGIRRLPKTSLPIILAHHNVLPQALLRIDIYTEVINGGPVRARLLSLERAVLYCHGHIHTDPVEVVLDPRNPSSRLVLISAPHILQGFNLIRLYFSRSGSPVGCEIVPYRLKDHGGITPHPPVRVALCTAHDVLLQNDDVLRSVVGATRRDFERFEVLRRRLHDNPATRFQRNTIGDALRDADWMSLVEIDNQAQDPIHWLIRRVEP